jgi:hypothetical protein
VTPTRATAISSHIGSTKPKRRRKQKAKGRGFWVMKGGRIETIASKKISLRKLAAYALTPL